METKTITIEGIKYKSALGVYLHTCDGCVAEFDCELCDKIQEEVDGNCRTIWLKEEVLTASSNEPTTEPKYTVEEVLTVLEDYGYYTTDSEADSIKSELQNKSDPEYKQYLALKAKFGE